MRADRGKSPPTGWRRRFAAASVLIAMAAAVLDASSVNIALPAAATTLGLSPSAAAWLVIAYQASLAASLLPLAAIGERAGYRSTFRVGIGVFAIGALLSSLVSSFAWMIACRALQGVGGAAIMALGVALLRQTVAPADFGKAIGWNAMAVAMTSAAGPTVGAAFLALGSWRFVFVGSIAPAIIAWAAGSALPVVPAATRKLDWRGAILYASIVPSFAVATGLARSSPTASALFVLTGILGTAIMVVRDRRKSEPFLPFDLLRDRAFRGSLLSSICCFTGLSLALLMLPFALQARLPASAAQIALLMTPWPVAVFAMTPLTTRLLERLDAALLCTAGGFCLGGGLGMLAIGSSQAGALYHLVAIALCGAGFGLFQTPNNRTMFLAAPPARAASAGGMQGTARLTGQMAGSLLASLLLSMLGSLAAHRLGFAIASCTALAAGTIALSRRRSSGSSCCWSLPAGDGWRRGIQDSHRSPPDETKCVRAASSPRE